MLTDLKGHTALITGASSGIGRAIALRLAKEGADLCITARREDVLKTLATECEALGVKVLVVVADAMDPSQLTAAADKAFAAFAGVFCLSNGTPEEIARTVQAFRRKADVETRTVIQIASIASKKSFSFALPYCASKYGVLGFTTGLFELPELRENGIKVCTINPGFVNTPMVHSQPGHDFAKMIQPDDIAETVAFVAKFPDNACPTEITIMPQRGPGPF